MKTKLTSLALLVFVLFSSCADDRTDQIVTIKTSYGDMIVVLYDETPKHKENFLKLANEKFYDSLIFHRVIEGFMIQGGDPDSKRAQPGQNLGQGGPGYNIPSEINPKYYHEKGALAAARLGDQQNPQRESSGSQFYIVHGSIIPEVQVKIDQQKMNQAMQTMYQSGEHQPMFDSLMALYNNGDMKGYEEKVATIVPRVEKASGIKVTSDASPEKVKAYSTVGGTPFLDNQYTVFGKVIKGLDVIDKIATVQKGPGDRPAEDIRFTVTVDKMSRRKVEKEYGYKYPEVEAPKK